MAPHTAELAARPLDDEDLLTLLGELRDAGFPIGVSEHLNAFELAQACRGAEGDVDPRRLRNWLAPVLCTRPEEQEEFYRRFEAWWRRLAPEPEPAAEIEPPARSELEEVLQRMRPGRWLAALAGLIVVLAAGLYLGQRCVNPGRLVEVPALAGSAEVDARTALEAAGLGVSIEGRLASTLPEGSVARQVPEAGERVEPAAVIQLWLAQPIEPVEVPEVVGLEVEEAIAALAERGLEVVIRETVPSERAEGTVLVQQPEAGERVAPGPMVRLWIAEPARNGRLARVTGRVVDLEGRALEGVRIWLEGVLGHEAEIASAILSPDGRHILTVSNDGKVRVWNADGREVPIVVLQGHAGRVLSAAFSPNGTRVVTASDDGSARVWDAVTGRELVKLEGHEGSVLSAAFSPDGTRVVTASADGTARVWDVMSGRGLARLARHEGAISSATFSPEGTRVVTASTDGTVRVWDVMSGRVVAKIEGHEATSASVAFSPDGTRVATASADGIARVWDVMSGRELAKLEGHEATGVSVAFSPDGTQVVTASADGTARVWNAVTGWELVKLDGHETAVFRAAFSPDGTRVVTASADGTARVWDAVTGRELAKLEGHKNWVMSAAFSPDGERIITASIDGTARVWSFTASNETGAFLIEAQPFARPRTLQVHHADHLPAATPCEIPSGPGELAVEARLALRGTASSRWLERNGVVVAYGLGLVPLLAAGTWWGWKRRRRELVLERRASREVREVAGFRLPEPRHGLFRGRDFVRARIGMRRRYAIGPGDLDADRTVDQSVRRLGFFSPVYRSRLRLPVYLALVDRAGFGDQQACLIGELLDQLIESGVEVERYIFDRDPRLCASIDHPERNRAGLRALAGRHPEHRLLLFGDGQGLFEPVGGRLASWTGLLAAWKERAILTPVPACHWGARETELMAAGFRVLPSTPEGLLRFAESPEPQAVEATADWRPPLPRLFAERPERWLDRNPPAPETLEELGLQLRLYLGPDGYRWLCALAVYPGLDWYLTLYLGLRLSRVEGEPLLSERALLNLTRLPWLRHGTIPDWLRLRLVSDLSAEDEATIRAFLYDLLRSPLEAPESRFALDVARPAAGAGRRWRPFVADLVRTEPSNSPLQDRVFVDFLMGRKPGKLQLLAPAAWRRWVWERGIRSLGLRPAAGLCVAAVLGAGGFFGAPAAITGLNDAMSTGEASTVSCQWNVAQVPVPDLLGLSFQEAKLRLEASALIAGAVIGNDTPEAVVASQEPGPMALAAVGSEVALRMGPVGSVSESVVVPDVIGLDLREATVIVEEAGLVLRVDALRPGPLGQPAPVFLQSPEGRDRVLRGSEVAVALGTQAPFLPADGSAGVIPTSEAWRERVLGPDRSANISGGGPDPEPPTGGVSGRVSTVTCQVETGPIADDVDAADRCTIACKAVGPWTGSWWSVQVGKNSVCRCRIEESLLEEISVDPQLGIDDCVSRCRSNGFATGAHSSSAEVCICSRVPVECSLEIGIEIETRTAP